MANAQNNTGALSDQVRRGGSSQRLSPSQLKKEVEAALDANSQTRPRFSGKATSKVDYCNTRHSWVNDDFSEEYCELGTLGTPQFRYRREIVGKHQERVKWQTCNLGLFRSGPLRKIVELVSKSPGNGRCVLNPLQWRSWHRRDKEKFIDIVAAMKGESCDEVRLLLMINGSYKAVSLTRLTIACHSSDFGDTESLVARAIAMCNNQSEEAAKVPKLTEGRLNAGAILRAVDRFQKRSRCNQPESRLARCFLAALAGDMDAMDGCNTPAPPNPPALIRVSGDFYRRGPQRWAAAEEHEVKDTLIKWLATEPDAKLSRNFTGAVFDCVKAECNLLPYVTKLNVWVQFDETPKVTQRYLLATENGLLDLEPMYREQPPKLLPHDASWLCLNALPYRFDSQATCKKWLSFLAEVLGPKAKGDKRIEVLQEWFGYCLLPRAQFQNSYCCMGRELTGKA